MPSPGKQHRKHDQPAPENHPPTINGSQSPGRSQSRLHQRPKADQQHEQSRINAVTRVPRQSRLTRLPSRGLPDSTPVSRALSRIQSIPKQARHRQPRGFRLGQTPLSGEIPLLLISKLLLLSSSRFSFGIQQITQGMPRHQSRRHRQHHHQPHPFCRGQAPRPTLGFIAIVGRHQDKHRYVQTKDTAYIKALHHALAQP